MKAPRKLAPATIEQAQESLEAACRNILSRTRWHPYGSKVNELRIPLAQLSKARRAAK